MSCHAAGDGVGTFLRSGHAGRRIHPVFVTDQVATSLPDPPHRPRRLDIAAMSVQHALRRVRDRERKWLSRRTKAGRFKRRAGCAAQRAARLAHAAAKRCREGRWRSGCGQRDYRETKEPSLSYPDVKEVPAHDSEASARARSRSPPTS